MFSSDVAETGPNATDAQAMDDASATGDARSDGGGGAMDARSDAVVVANDAGRDGGPTCTGSPLERVCNGVCTSIADDPLNCGTCGTRCPNSQFCGGGRCHPCPLTQLACGGACVDVLNNNDHCGSCNRPCAAGQLCRGGSCSNACAAPTTACVEGTFAYCTNLQLDAANCGRCGAACASGESCVAGRCQLACAAGQIACSGHCADTQTHNEHCGACGQRCSATQRCVAGACATPAACPVPSGISAQAQAALDRANSTRNAMGSGCARMDTTINTAAERHCRYYTSNTGACIADPHAEVSTCSMFVGARFSDRMRAAGYTATPKAEDMHFLGDGAAAVQGWIDSVWHRTPVLSPWTRDLGYGTVGRCDTMDFGQGETTPDSVVVTYPYAGQTGFPTSFGGNESPAPPTPPAGWPSGSIIHVYARGATIHSHVLRVDATGELVAHRWLGPGDSAFLRDEFVLYAHSPLRAATRYRVHVTGTTARGALNLDWTFTTR